MKARLTQKTASLLAHETRETWVWDTEVRGFGLRHRPGLPMAYWVRSGAVKRHLGPTSLLKAEQARELAREILFRNKVLKEPLQVSVVVKNPTIRDLYERVIEIEKTEISASTYRSKKTVWTNYIIPLVGDKPVGEITRIDVEKMFKSIEKKFMANMAVKYLSKALNMSETFVPHWRKNNSNPCLRFKVHTGNKRDIVLNKDEIRRLVDVLEEEKTNPTRRDAYPFLIYQLLITGLRFGEWANRKWTDIDFENKTMILKTTKNKKPRVIHLSAKSIADLERVPRVNEYIFPRIGHNKPIGIRHDLWSAIRKKAGIRPEVRVHDIRHTTASVAYIEKGLTLKEVQEMLGHSSIAITERYLNLREDQKRKIFETASSILD